MRRIVNDEALDILFRDARQPRVWLPAPISDTVLRALWELVRCGPTAAADLPVRVLFVRSEAAKAKLAPALTAEDRDDAMAAPVAAIIGHRTAAAPDAAQHDAILHAAYLILGARALGLDGMPVWRFDAARVDREFFPSGDICATSVCALGCADQTVPAHREVRPAFDEACSVL
jgi:nitroreductase